VYGLTSLTYVLVPLASVYFFGERVRQLQVVGFVLILAGIACVVSAD
jgi:drug/metabolite transporter (DMT)-like permease